MDIRKILLVMLFGFLVYLPNVTAQFVLPVFSGWYLVFRDQGPGKTVYDNCYQPHLAWEYEYSGQSEQEVAAKLAQLFLTQCHNLGYLDCVSKVVEGGWKVEDKPWDFPSTWEIDWTSIIEKNPKLATSEWHVECTYHGGWWGAYVRVFPRFQCPPGSRASYGDYDDGDLYSDVRCATKPRLCTGDIIGRDMSSSDNLGHVGIVYYSFSGSDQQVLEVLDKNPVIQVNYFTAFRKASSVYWQTKYGLPNVPYITREQRSDIIDKLWGDLSSNCDGVDYSLVPYNLHLCQYDPVKKKSVAVLRCDYFINEAYKAAGLKIVDFGLTTTPSDLFNAFLNYRFAYDPGPGPQEINEIPTVDPEKYLAQLQRKLDHLSWYLLERHIDDTFSRQDIDLYDIQWAMYVYLTKNSLESDIGKKRFLWDLAIKYQNNKDKFEYLIGTVAYLKPLELTDEMINEYYRQTNIANKLILLEYLEGLHIEGTSAYEKIENLFNDIALHENNMEILKKAIIDVPFSFEKREAYINQILQRSDVGEQLEKTMFANPSYYGIQLTRILPDLDLQRKYLKDFFDQVEKYGDPHLLSGALYAHFAVSEGWYASPADRDPKAVTSLDPAKLDDSVRPLLIHYLETHQPAANLPEGQDREYYAWLRTYMAVQSKDFDEMRKRVADYIKSVDDLPYKAVLLSHTDKSIYDTQFSNDELVAILKAINTKRAELSKSTQKIIPISEMNKPHPELIVPSQLFQGKIRLDAVLEKRGVNLLPEGIRPMRIYYKDSTHM